MDGHMPKIGMQKAKMARPHNPKQRSPNACCLLCNSTYSSVLSRYPAVRCPTENSMLSVDDPNVGLLSAKGPNKEGSNSTGLHIVGLYAVVPYNVRPYAVDPIVLRNAQTMHAKD